MQLPEEKKWYAVYTKPRYEKKAAYFLEKQGITHWLPMQRLRKQWSDRVKWVEEPVFKSYLFVQIAEREYFATLNTHGVARFISFEGKATPISEDQMDLLRRMLDTGYEMESDVISFRQGALVEVRTGPLAGRQGTLVSRAGDKKVRLDLQVLQQSVFITVPMDNLLLIDSAPVDPS